jgi:gliding motility-associated-like protein
LEGKDNIKELFSDKLGNYEASVNPELWAKVASQIGATTTTVVSTGLSALTKWIIGIGISTAAITTAVVLINSANTTESSTLTSELDKNQSTIKQELRTNQPNTTTLVDADPVVESDQVAEITVTPEDRTDKVIRMNPIPKPAYEPISSLPIYSVAGGVSNSVHNPSIVQGVNSLASTDPNSGMPEPTEPAKASHSIAQYTNVFSPNGDGTNDVFELEIVGVSEFSIVILDAEGKSVFKSNEVDFRWDGGDMTGRPVPDGRYVYIITGYDQEGRPVPEYRTLSIYR